MKDQAIALHRISSKGQAEGHSLEAQALSTEKMAHKLKVPIVNSWSIIQSSNRGKNFRRKDIEQILSYCRKNRRVGYLLIDFVNRLMREVEIMIYYKVLLNELGVKLVFCDPTQHHLNGEDQYAQLMLLIEGYKTEQENKMRADISTSRMITRTEAGYYLSHPHPGYMKSDIPGLHIPDPSRFELLQKCCRLIIYKQYTSPQAVKWINSQGYRTLGNKKLDVNHFSNFIKNRYYCGKIDIRSRDWPKGINGLHQPMLSVKEHKLLTDILTKRNPRIRRKHNPEFPMSNLLRHMECKDVGHYEKFTGHNFNPGKRPSGTQRPLKPVYDCRNCRRRISRDVVHQAISSYLSDINLLPDEKRFKEALTRVWKQQRGSETQRLYLLQKNKSDIEQKIIETTSAYTSETDETVRKSLRMLLKDYDSKLTQTNSDIDSVKNTDMESDKFVRFAMDFTTNLRERWWQLSWENKVRGEQILFNGKIYFDNDAKVHTPYLSTIYRLGTNKKALSKLDNAHLVELPDTASGSDWLHPGCLQA